MSIKETFNYCWDGVYGTLGDGIRWGLVEIGGIDNDDLATHNPKSTSFAHNFWHIGADKGDKASRLVHEGKPLKGIATAAFGAPGVVISAGETTLKNKFHETLNGGIWNNVVMAVVGGLAGYIGGSLVGSFTLPFAGSTLGGVGGLIGGAGIGWLAGDQLMQRFGWDLEGNKPETISNAPVKVTEVKPTQPAFLHPTYRIEDYRPNQPAIGSVPVP